MNRTKMVPYSIIGIDFGTSATVVKIKNYYDGMSKGDSQSLIIGGSPTIPTQVFIRNDGQYFYGGEVESEVQAGSQGELCRNFKMELISPDAVVRQKAEHITKKFFEYLYREYSKQKSQLNVLDSVKIYVSYPAKWTPQVISFMKQCVVEAGFGSYSSVFGETEPMAAIYAALTNNEEIIKQKQLIAQGHAANVLMLDMGAGTSDVTIFKLLIDQDNNIQIGQEGQIITHPSIDNSYLCGGREIDSILTNYNIEYLSKALPAIQDALKKQISDSMKSWKEVVVSPSLKKGVDVSAPSAVSSLIMQLKACGFAKDIPYRNINRGIFESTSKTHWEQLHSLIVDAINKASAKFNNLKGAQDIDLVIVTGGHGQWYVVEDMIFGKEICGLQPINFSKIQACPERYFCQARPQETVANGMVFRDLKFDVTHTSSNNLWIKFKLNNIYESDWFNPISIYKIIPCTVSNIRWKHKIHDSASSLNDAVLTCICAYGIERESAIISETNVAVSLNGLFHLIGGILDDIFGDGREIEYLLSINASVSIKEDGSGSLDGNISSDRNDWTSPSFHIDL